ncbi:MAG: sialidase family protein [Candidatus Latescibacterota bacterium]
MRHSDDLGLTWGQPVRVHEGGTNSPRVQRLADGSLLVALDLHGPHYEVWLYRSTDGGHTWQALGTLCAPQAGGHSGCVPIHVAELSDDSWLLASSWANGDPWSLEDGEQLEIHRSADRGRSWTLHSTFVERPHSLGEASLVPMPGGRIWLFARENHVTARGGRLLLRVDGEAVLDKDQVDARAAHTACTPTLSSPHVFAFGNEPLWLCAWNLGTERAELGAADWPGPQAQQTAAPDGLPSIPPMLMLSTGVAAEQVTPTVTGYSLWRRLEARLGDPQGGAWRQAWDARQDGFPDQYQLDRVLEVDASIRGWDQGYSGWVELADGRIYVVNYTDDTAPACPSTPDWPGGLPRNLSRVSPPCATSHARSGRPARSPCPPR